MAPDLAMAVTTLAVPDRERASDSDIPGTREDGSVRQSVRPHVYVLYLQGECLVTIGSSRTDWLIETNQEMPLINPTSAARICHRGPPCRT